MVRVCTGLLLVLSLAAGAAATQAEPLRWSQDSERLPVDSGMDYWVEKGGAASLRSVMALPESDWQSTGPGSVSLGYNEKTYWFRMKLENPSGETLEPFLEIGYPVLDRVDFYHVRNSQEIHHSRVGNKQFFSERPVNHRNFVIPLTLTPGDDHRLYFRVQTKSALQLPVTLWDPVLFYDREQSQKLFQGLYYGIALVMIIYHLFVFRALRERMYLFYAGFITAMPLFLSTLSGLAFQYLWPYSTWWNDQAIMFALNGVIFFGLLFTRDFLAISNRSHPWIHRIMVVVIVAAALQALSTLFISYDKVVVSTIALAVVACSFQLWVGGVRIYQGNAAARYFTTAFALMLTGGILLAMSKFTVLPRNFFTENATQLGSAVGIILLSLALADRLNREKKAAFHAQQQLLEQERRARQAQEETLRVEQEANSQLEIRVRERTEELERANKQLKALSAHDELTGLKNRRAFDEQFQTLTVNAYRLRQPLGVLILDIDHFKSFNDNYGHLVGDECLKMVAGIIHQNVTRPGDLPARYGGEEFVVVLADTPSNGALKVAERIRSSLEQRPFTVAGTAVPLTVSIGVSVRTPEHADEASTLFAEADGALYQAKRNGRNQVVLHQPQEALDEEPR
ncbi:MAG: diguanylate cyclase [Oleiphilaceae bacterium]|nr:diguanylate cyclase [Oleiphilaceae bacterium]